MELGGAGTPALDFQSDPRGVPWMISLPWKRLSVLEVGEHGTRSALGRTQAMVVQDVVRVQSRIRAGAVVFREGPAPTRAPRRVCMPAPTWRAEGADLRSDRVWNKAVDATVP